MQVDQSFIDALEDKLSTPRLSTYKSYFNCTDDAQVLSVYLWNKALATAFFPLLQATEITLRNAIHSSATNHFSGNSEWFLMKKFPNAKKKSEEWLYEWKHGKRVPVTPRPSSDAIVAKLSFGFWVNLLTKQYNDPVNNHKLWPGLIPLAFPNAHGTEATRASLHQRFKFIKDFRNRVGHYEPLWKIQDTVNGGGIILRHGPKTPAESIIRLNEHVDLIMDALKWMSFERHDFIIGTGLVEHVRALCSPNALAHYQGNSPDPKMFNKIYKEILKKKSLENSVSGFYRFRTSKKGSFQGEDLLLDIKHIRLPRLK